MKHYIILYFLIYAGIFNLNAQAVLSIETKDLNGNRTTIGESIYSEIIVLDFWATWCKPCVKSIPKLVELSAKYKSEEVGFIGINEDSPRNINKVKPFVNSLKINYPVLLDPEQEIMSELVVSSFPTLVVINQEAKVLYVHEGYSSGDEIIIEEKINNLLDNND